MATPAAAAANAAAETATAVSAGTASSPAAMALAALRVRLLRWRLINAVEIMVGDSAKSCNNLQWILPEPWRKPTEIQHR